MQRVRAGARFVTTPSRGAAASSAWRRGVARATSLRSPRRRKRRRRRLRLTGRHRPDDDFDPTSTRSASPPEAETAATMFIYHKQTFKGTKNP